MVAKSLERERLEKKGEAMAQEIEQGGDEEQVETVETLPTENAADEQEAPKAPPSDLKQASDDIKEKLADALHKTANATVSISSEGDHWKADVEIVEEEYLPGQKLKSMNDLLGLYDVTMDTSGKLLNWTKKKMYKRSQGL